MQTHVIVLGAGFGGVEVARTLRKYIGDTLKVTVISQKPYFEYYPGLYRVLSSEPPFEVFVPLKNILPKKVELINATVAGINLKERQVTIEKGAVLSYDILVVALGNEAFYFNTPGVETYALGCKSLTDVRYLRRDLIGKINRLQDEGTPLHVLIAGGGPTGVEMAGQVTALFRDEVHFDDVDRSKLSVGIVQSAPHLVPQLPEKISKIVEARLKKINVELYLGTKIVEQKEGTVILSHTALDTDTLIWTAGSQVNRVVQETEGFACAPNKKIIVDDQLLAQGFPDVYVIGDVASTTYSGLAQTAMKDGAFVGDAIRRRMFRLPLRGYQSVVPASVMPVGRFWGVFHYKGIIATGLIPHMMRYAVDVFYFWKRLSLVDFLRLYLRGKLH